MDRPEVWTHLRARERALADARAVDARATAGAELPLAGWALAVKDNIDVAGLPTTAGCPAYAYTPAVDAPAVARLRAAGAVVLGKTNMDQFATGLVGTRSPYGAVRDARDPARVSGGSSSGSAVAVALELADLALGTDTAGSGRVPAAFQGVVGLKPTRGLVPRDGVVPACRSFDCVSLFARTVSEAELAGELLTSTGGADPLPRHGWPPHAPASAPEKPLVAIPSPGQLSLLSPGYASAFARVTRGLPALGLECVEVDLGVLLEAGELLYEGGFVAERHQAVGEFIRSNRSEIDPSVAQIILAASSITAAQYLADSRRLAELRAAACEMLRGCDALLLPTTVSQPTIAEVAEDPIELNRRLGRYTTFCNLLDMCAIAVPAGVADCGQFGVTLFGAAFHDRVLTDLAKRLAVSTDAPSRSAAPEGVPRTASALLCGATQPEGRCSRSSRSRGRAAAAFIARRWRRPQ